jgi:hypothetical protein
MSRLIPNPVGIPFFQGDLPCPPGTAPAGTHGHRPSGSRQNPSRPVWHPHEDEKNPLHVSAPYSALQPRRSFLLPLIPVSRGRHLHVFCRTGWRPDRMLFAHPDKRSGTPGVFSSCDYGKTTRSGFRVNPAIRMDGRVHIMPRDESAPSRDVLKGRPAPPWSSYVPGSHACFFAFGEKADKFFSWLIPLDLKPLQTAGNYSRMDDFVMFTPDLFGPNYPSSQSKLCLSRVCRSSRSCLFP